MNPVIPFDPSQAATTPNTFGDFSDIDPNAGGWKMPVRAPVKPIKSMKEWFIDYEGQVGEEVDKELDLLIADGNFHHYAKNIEDEYGTWNIFASYKDLSVNFLYLQLLKDKKFIVGKIRSPFERPLMRDRFPMIDNVDLDFVCRLKVMLIELSQGKTKEEILDEWEKDKVEKPNF